MLFRSQHTQIEQRLHWADNRKHRDDLLDQLLTDRNMEQAVVFTSTQRDADELADRLSQIGHSVAALHGGMPQGRRNRVLGALRMKQLKVLVATDVAARGIDVPTITHVINYGLPMKAEDYVHRIGRTGRAGRSGLAITIAERRDIPMIRRIERFTTHNIPAAVVAGLEPRLQAPAAQRPGSGRFEEERSFGGHRPSFGGNRGGFNGPRGGDRPGYGPRPGFGGDRPNFGGDRGHHGGDRPQFNGGERPAFNRDGGDNRGFSGDRPAFNGPRGDYRGQRPDNRGPAHPFQGGAPREGGDRPAFNREGGDRPFVRPQGDRPAFNREGGDRAFARPHGDRPHGDRPAYGAQGDRPSFGPKRNGPGGPGPRGRTPR